VYDALDGTVRVVANRVEEFLRLMIEFGPARHELARDRIVAVVAVDDAGQRRRQRDGVARGDLLQTRQLRGQRKALLADLRRAADG
jgi:hypothetical protein